MFCNVILFDLEKKNQNKKLSSLTWIAAVQNAGKVWYALDELSHNNKQSILELVDKYYFTL